MAYLSGAQKKKRNKIKWFYHIVVNVMLANKNCYWITVLSWVFFDGWIFIWIHQMRDATISHFIVYRKSHGDLTESVKRAAFTRTSQTQHITKTYSIKLFKSNRNEATEAQHTVRVKCMSRCIPLNDGENDRSTKIDEYECKRAHVYIEFNVTYQKDIEKYSQKNLCVFFFSSLLFFVLDICFYCVTSI